MTRLIDADKLKEELKINGLGYQYYMLDNAPTVKAIPISFIKECITKGDDWTFDKDTLWHLIEVWEKKK